MEIKRISGRVWLEVVTVFLLFSTISTADQFERCFLVSSKKYGVNIHLLKAIAEVESGMQPYAVNVNLKGKNRSFFIKNRKVASEFITYLEKKGYNFDVGISQINIKNIRRFGLSPVELLDPCKNIDLSARIMRELIDRHGMTWDAVWRYNGNKRYAKKVLKALKEIRKK
ncbi:MAG TPA: lytic transglycosylase [Persephonella sp.]|uniref:Soluble lytic murein transglycosylase n=1 Tax=Persephonella marina (strain DSM 14350 / EX-H1) TaxID=123214 RepID=C0QSR4_PERMH|nr:MULTISPECIES: lytic transglycosylase domain-containing protein [Persephonella]ACO03675.1 soluble lytic murein transglycosylase [Persephonella marina EX-H1]HCB70652.1 lytic transglycosylase [Persephonella sp.]